MPSCTMYCLLADWYLLVDALGAVLYDVSSDDWLKLEVLIINFNTPSTIIYARAMMLESDAILCTRYEWNLLWDSLGKFLVK